MKLLLLSVLSIVSGVYLTAQPATEVYLFDLKKKGNSYELRNATNVSANPGQYDNQPSFSADGKTVYYVSMDTSGQTDIYFYSIRNGSRTNFSQTPAASEYSPTLTPDGQFISTIRVVGEEQLLWKFPLGGGEPLVVVPNLVIGYHAWWNNNTIVSFVLGDPQTLQVTTLSSNSNKIVAENIGRSIYKMPGRMPRRMPGRMPRQNLISFLQNRNGQPSLIQSLNPETGERSILAEALPNSQDMAWTPAGEILMGQGSALFIQHKNSSDWTKIAQLDEQFGLTVITRIAVSPNGKRLALVVNE